MNQGALHFNALLTTSDFESGMAKIRYEIRTASGLAKAEASKMESTFSSLGRNLGIAFSGAALGGFINQVINIRGEFQKTEVAFSTMLGSQEKAAALMSQMVELAASTPFSLQDVSAGAKQLLAFQIPAEQVVDTLTRMGNIAAGLGVPLSRINLIYGQVLAKGKLAGDDLRQFTEAGIPMVAMLAKNLNKANSEIIQMVSDGKIGFSDVQKVLFDMTETGGMFFNLMDKQSKTLSGKMANLGDTIDQVLNKLGQSQEGILADSIDAASYLVENYETLIEILTVAIATYGLYKTALMANLAWTKLNETAVVQQALSQGTLTLAQARGAAMTVMLQRAQASLNATLLANPIGVVIGLIAGLSYVIYKNISATTAWEEIQDNLNAKIKQHSTSLDEQKSKIDTLIKVIKDKNTSDEAAAKALVQLNGITGNRIKGLTVEGIRLGQNTKALNAYLQVMEKEVRLRALIDEKIELEKRNRDIDRDNPNNLTFGERFSNFQGIGDVIRGVTAQERKRRAMLENRMATNKRLRENEAETQRLLQEGIKIADDSVVNTLNTGTENVKEAKEKRERELAEVYSLNSIADLEQRISLWNEALQKASGDTVEVLTKNKFGDTVKTGNTVSVNQALAELEELEKAKSKRQKEISIRNFEEELNEIKRQTEVRDKLLKAGYDKTTVDEMFPQIKDQSFLQYLEKLGNELEKRPLSEMKEDLIILQNVLNEYTGAETFIDNVNKQIENLKSKFSGNELIEKLEAFKKASLEGTTGDEKNAKRQAVERAQEEELDRQRQLYQTLLKEQQTYQEKALALQKEFEDMKNSDAYRNGSDADRDKINASFSQRATDLFFNEMARSEEWVKVFTNMNLVSSSKLEEFKRILQTKLSEAKTIEEKIKIGEFIERIDETLRTRNPFKAIKDMIKAIGDESLTTEEKIQRIIDGAGAAQSYLQKMSGMVSDLRGIFDDLGISTDNTFGDVLSDIEQTIEGLDRLSEGVSEFAMGYASGNPIQMVAGGIKAIGGVIKAVSGWFNDDDKRERNIQRYTLELQELERVFASLNRTIRKTIDNSFFDVSNAAINNLRAQQVKLRQMINDEQGKKNADSGKIQDYQNQIAAIDNSIEDMISNMADKIMAGMNAQSITDRLSDALVSAFENGEDAALAMGRTVDQMLRDMVINALKMEILAPAMKKVVDQIMASMGYNQVDNSAEISSAQATLAQLEAELANTKTWDTKKSLELQAKIAALKAYIENLKAGQGVGGAFDGMSEEERQEIKDMIANASNDFTTALQQYEDLFGDAAGAAMGMKGDIKGITEKTAGKLEGQINTMRMYQADILTIHKANKIVFENSLKELIKIEWNTRRLHSIDDGIKELNAKVKKSLAGIP